MDESYGPWATTRRTGKGNTILLIDDNPDQCDLIQTVLQACMPEVNLLVVTTVEEALSQLRLCLAVKKGLPRLILLDLYLPRVEDGLLTLEQIKKPGSPYRLIPLTLLTHSTKKQDIQRVYDLGANSYIVKPTNYDQWQLYFESLRQYWWHTVTPPPT